MKNKETKIIPIDRNKKPLTGQEEVQRSKGIGKRVNYVYFDSLKEIDDLSQIAKNTPARERSE